MWFWIGLGLLALICFVIVYACLIAGSRADDAIERERER